MIFGSYKFLEVCIKEEKNRGFFFCIHTFCVILFLYLDVTKEKVYKLNNPNQKKMDILDHHAARYVVVKKPGLGESDIQWANACVQQCTALIFLIETEMWHRMILMPHTLSILIINAESTLRDLIDATVSLPFDWSKGTFALKSTLKRYDKLSRLMRLIGVAEVNTAATIFDSLGEGDVLDQTKVLWGVPSTGVFAENSDDELLPCVMDMVKELGMVKCLPIEDTLESWYRFKLHKKCHQGCVDFIINYVKEAERHRPDMPEAIRDKPLHPWGINDTVYEKAMRFVYEHNFEFSHEIMSLFSEY